MAGIGFRLKAVLAEDTYLAVFRAYLYSAVISSGPWLVSVLGLALLAGISTAYLPQEDRAVFFGTIVYAFALSLITTGGPQMIVTRYLADRLYVKDVAALLPTFVGALGVTLAIQLAVGVPLFGLLDLPLLYRLAAIALFLSVGAIWMITLFLSAARDYEAVVLAYAAGYATAVGAAITLGSRYGISGHIGGFAIGHAVLVAVLASRVFAEFGSAEATPSTAAGALAWVGHVGKYPALLGIGLLYNLGVWADKLVLWTSVGATVSRGFLRTYPMYDASMFLAYLTMVPALAVFLTSIETSFYGAYRRFYAAIGDKRSLAEIEGARLAMAASLRTSLASILKLQVAIALLAIVFAPQILHLTGLPPSGLAIFRLGVLAVGVQVFLLIALLILLYLDLRGSALVVSLTFLVGNLGLTALSLRAGYAWLGTGYLGAALVAVLLALMLLDRALVRLDYLTFSRQPIAAPEG